MKTFKGQLLVLLIVYIRDSSCSLDAVYVAGKAVWELYSIINKMKFDVADAMDQPPNDNVTMIKAIKNQMDEIHKQLDSVEEFMHPKIVHDFLTSWPNSIMLYKCIDTLEIYISSVDEHYKTFRLHMNQTSYRTEELQEFMEWISSNVNNDIHMIRSYVLNKTDSLPDHRNLIYAITGNAAILQPQLCNSRLILSRVLVKLFEMTMIAEMKTNIIFAIRKVYQSLQTTGLMDVYTQEQFEKQLGLYLDLFSLNVELIDTVYIRACDPDDNWIRGKSFYEFEGTFQTAIFRYNSIDCARFGICDDLLSKKADQCDVQYYDDRSGCSTFISECVQLDAVQACVLKNGAHKFQYVNSSRLGFLGTNSECPQDSGYIIEDGRSLNPPHDICACNCNGDNNKIGLFIMNSNVESNMVITGIRFMREDQILYIQPKEGKLGPDGRILRYSERWVRIPSGIHSYQIQSIDVNNKLFFFDDVTLPPGLALIGVKFDQVRRGDLKGFAIVIYGVPFDYRSGKLDLDPKTFQSMQSPNGDPGEPLSFKAVSSVYAHSPQTPSPRSKKYVYLKRSNLIDDFGQSTLPLFDAVPVITDPSSVLGGVGIFHKGSEGYAGFISLRLYGVRYAEYFRNFTVSTINYSQIGDVIKPTN